VDLSRDDSPDDRPTRKIGLLRHPLGAAYRRCACQISAQRADSTALRRRVNTGLTPTKRAQFPGIALGAAYSRDPCRVPVLRSTRMIPLVLRHLRLALTAAGGRDATEGRGVHWRHPGYLLRAERTTVPRSSTSFHSWPLRLAEPGRLQSILTAYRIVTPFSSGAPPSAAVGSALRR